MLCGHRLHVGLGLLDGYARLEAAHGQQPMEVVIQLFRLEDERHDEPLIEAIGLAWGEHANDRVWRTVNLDLLADDVGIGAEPLPQLVQKNDNVFLAGNAFLGQEVAAITEFDAHHPVHAGRCLLALKIFGLVLGGQVEASAREGVQVLRRLCFVASSQRNPAPRCRCGSPESSTRP